MGRRKLSAEERAADFRARLVSDSKTGCLLFPGKVSKKNPYGAVKTADGRVVGAHVMAVEIATGKPVPKEYEVHHLIEEGVCSSKLCCLYPGHLVVVQNHDSLPKARARPKKDYAWASVRGDAGETRDGEKEDGHMRATPGFVDFLGKHLYDALVQKENLGEAQKLIQQDREDDFDRWAAERNVPKLEYAADPLHQGATCYWAVHMAPRCGLPVFVRWEPPGEKAVAHQYHHQYGDSPTGDIFVPHAEVCPLKTSFGYDDYSGWALYLASGGRHIQK